MLEDRYGQEENKTKTCAPYAFELAICITVEQLIMLLLFGFVSIMKY